MGKVLQVIISSGGSGSEYVSQSAPSEKRGSFGTEPKQTVVSWSSLLIARSCMHDICVFSRWLKTWKIERSNRVLKPKLRATQRERRRVCHKTGDKACRDSGSGTMGVEPIGSDGNPESFSVFWSKAIFTKSCQGLTTCVSLLYCSTSTDVVDGRRGKNETT